MKTKEELAKEYAERVCNGEFPITYTREEVVKHTSNDFIAGYNKALENNIDLKEMAEKEGYGYLMFLLSAMWRNKVRANGYPLSGVFVPALPHEIKDKEISDVLKELELYERTVK